ncbi:permease-like cell division protein FtsX [Patescibacteria group bacterium]|nr:permease-like cell division protein FtsX [Patescibacteria group bacterium]
MMGLILFIFNIVMVLNVLTTSSINTINEKADLIIYVSENASMLNITNMLNDIKSLPVVKEAEYKSAGEALKDFLKAYPDKADPFSTYNIDNPLPGNIRILTKKPEQHPLVIDYLNTSNYKNLLLDMESSNENQEIVSRLVKVTSFTEKLIIGVIITFVFGSLLIIINAIHLSIFTRKREIQIMQLVGARPSMIRFPFVFEGAIYSTVAVFFSFFLLVAFIEGSHLMEFQVFKESFYPASLFGLELAGSILIGVISSFFAINYYLKRTLVLDK